MKSAAERSFERMTLGAMLILIGIEFWIGLPAGTFPLFAAIILLGSAFYQRSQGWDVGFLTWLFGGLFALAALCGIIGWLVGLWPFILIALGVAMLLNLKKDRGVAWH